MYWLVAAGVVMLSLEKRHGSYSTARKTRIHMTCPRPWPLTMYILCTYIMYITYTLRWISCSCTATQPESLYFCPFPDRYMRRKKVRCCSKGLIWLSDHIFPVLVVRTRNSTNAVELDAIDLVSLFRTHYSGCGRSWQNRKFLVSAVCAHIWPGYYSRRQIFLPTENK